MARSTTYQLIRRVLEEQKARNQERPLPFPPQDMDGATADPGVDPKTGKRPLITHGPNKGQEWRPDRPGPTAPGWTPNPQRAKPAPQKPDSKQLGLEEGRGRPRKNPNDPKWQKKSVNGEEGEDDFGPDRGPEPDKNIQVQLKKAVDSKDEKGGADVEFANGKKKFVPHHVASAVLGALNKMKPEHRGKAQDMLQQSHENLMAVHQSLKK